MLEFLISVLLTVNLQGVPDTNEPPPMITRIDSSRPVVSARAAMITDIKSGTVLYAKNENERLPIASITKLMTAKIILENHDLSEVVTVPAGAVEAAGSSMHLFAGERITIESLLNGLLIQSGNDAALALAIYDAGSVSGFVSKMNVMADSMGLKNTNFQNPTGFDHPLNYSTAKDLTALASDMYDNPVVREIVGRKEFSVKSASGRTTHKLKSTNTLLGNYLNIVGLKTGRTAAAKGCFIGITDSEQPHISVVLGSPVRFADTKILLDWSKNTFEYTQL